jgi:hypothetical protein
MPSKLIQPSFILFARVRFWTPNNIVTRTAQVSLSPIGRSLLGQKNRNRCRFRKYLQSFNYVFD